MKDIKLLFIFGLIAMVTWSCSNSTAPENDEDFASPPYANAMEIAPADSAMGLAQNISGFGGIFIKDSRLIIFLTQPSSQKAKAKEVLSNSEFVEKYIDNTSASVTNMKIKKGEYTLIKLNKWEKEIGSNILGMVDGAYTIGIDQSQNRVTLGVENKTVKAKMKNRLEELNIPENAVGIYKMTINFPIGN